MTVAAAGRLPCPSGPTAYRPRPRRGLGGHRLELRRVGSNVYLKAPDEYWKAALRPADANAAAGRRDKYVRIDADDSRFEDITRIAEYGNVATVVTDWRSPAKERSEEIVDGTRTIVPGLCGGPRLHVPATGNPVPIRLELPENGTVEWSDLGKPVDVTAPSTSDTVDLPSEATNPTN
ncbi:hypothetical protein [Embleya sp. NPDC059237]|uniref:hypothetical protein n=1 Tax=Embleya sp. NPDC059237 TaxID=3346784 RepID=UPI0036775357